MVGAYACLNMFQKDAVLLLLVKAAEHWTRCPPAEDLTIACTEASAYVETRREDHVSK